MSPNLRIYIIKALLFVCHSVVTTKHLREQRTRLGCGFSYNLCLKLIHKLIDIKLILVVCDSLQVSVSCETQTSPGNSPRSFRRTHHHSHSHSHHHHNVNGQHRIPQKTNQSQVITYKYYISYLLAHKVKNKYLI